MATLKPQVVDGVHYVNSGHSLGTAAGTCRAALVTEVKNDTTVSLAVFTPRGTLFYESLTYDEGKAAGTWHWPETVNGPTSSIYSAKDREQQNSSPQEQTRRV